MNELQISLSDYIKSELQEHFRTWDSDWIVNYFVPLLHGKLTRGQIEAAAQHAMKN